MSASEDMPKGQLKIIVKTTIHIEISSAY